MTLFNQTPWRQRVKNDCFDMDPELRTDVYIEDWIRELKLLLSDLDSQLMYHRETEGKDEWRRKTRFLKRRVEMRLTEAKDLMKRRLDVLYGAVRAHRDIVVAETLEGEGFVDEDTELWRIFGLWPLKDQG